LEDHLHALRKHFALPSPEASRSIGASMTFGCSSGAGWFAKCASAKGLRPCRRQHCTISATPDMIDKYLKYRPYMARNGERRAQPTQLPQAPVLHQHCVVRALPPHSFRGHSNKAHLQMLQRTLSCAPARSRPHGSSPLEPRAPGFAVQNGAVKAGHQEGVVPVHPGVPRDVPARVCISSTAFRNLSDSAVHELTAVLQWALLGVLHVPSKDFWSMYGVHSCSCGAHIVLLNRV